MALDDVIRGEVLQYGGATGSLKGTVSRIRAGEGPSDRGTLERQNLDLILAYILETNNSEMTPGDAQAILSDRRVTDEMKTQAFMPYLVPAYEHFKGNLVDRVSQNDNYHEMISNINGESILNVALSVTPSEDIGEEYTELVQSKRKYEEWTEKHEAGDTAAYLNSIHPAFKTILESTNKEGTRIFSDENIKEYIKRRISYHQEILLSGLGVNVEMYEQGKRTRNQELVDSSINGDTIREYLTAVSGNIEDDQRSELYEATGIVYADHLAIEARNAQNAAHQANIA